jgi:hypothetical protein
MEEASNSVHLFEVDPDVFRAIVTGLQHAVVAADELDIRTGDQIILREWITTGPAGRGHYSGYWICRRVTSRIPGGAETGILDGFSVLSVNNASENEYATTHLRKELLVAHRRGIQSERFFELKAAAERKKREQRAPVPLERVS